MGVPFPTHHGTGRRCRRDPRRSRPHFRHADALASLCLACDVAGAIMFFHAKHGFFVPDGIEFVLSLFAAAVALGLAGAGEYSIDALVARRRADAAVQPTYRSQSR